LLRIVRGDARDVGARVQRVDDLVAVAVGAAVPLRVVARRAGLVRAGVGGVGDAVVIPVGRGRAAVLGRIVARQAGLIRAGVDVVEDGVAVAIARGRGRR